MNTDTQPSKGLAHFSPIRLFLLIQRDFLTHYRTIAIFTAAIAGFVIFTSTLSSAAQSGNNFHQVLFFLILYIGGFIFTSRAFRELFSSQKSYTYLTLPGSTLEKFVARLLLTSLIFTLGTLAVYLAIAAVSEGINKLLIGNTHQFLDPFSKKFLVAAAAYLVIQGVFLAGAVFFRKNAFIKTILSLMVLSILLLIIALIVARIVSPGYFGNIPRTNFQLDTLSDLASLLGMTEEGLLQLGRAIRIGLKILFWAVLAPFLWVISYLKFRRIEA
jgi:hypothetical protein